MDFAPCQRQETVNTRWRHWTLASVSQKQCPLSYCGSLSHFKKLLKQRISFNDGFPGEVIIMWNDPSYASGVLPSVTEIMNLTTKKCETKQSNSSPFGCWPPHNSVLVLESTQQLLCKGEQQVGRVKRTQIKTMSKSVQMIIQFQHYLKT